MPKILQMFRRKQRRKSRRKSALGLSDNAVSANIILFPHLMNEIQEDYPDHETISRWLKLADEMLGSADYPQMDDYNDRHGRKKA